MLNINSNNICLLDYMPLSDYMAEMVEEMYIVRYTDKFDGIEMPSGRTQLIFRIAGSDSGNNRNINTEPSHSPVISTLEKPQRCHFDKEDIFLGIILQPWFADIFIHSNCYQATVEQLSMALQSANLNKKKLPALTERLFMTGTPYNIYSEISKGRYFKEVKRYISYLDRYPFCSVEELMDKSKLYIGEKTLSCHFRKYIGISIGQYALLQKRLALFKYFVQGLPILKISVLSGYNCQYVSSMMKKWLSVPPSHVADSLKRFAPHSLDILLKEQFM